MTPMRGAQHRAYLWQRFGPGEARVVIRRRDDRWTVSVVPCATGPAPPPGFDLTFHPNFADAIAEMTAILTPPRRR
jgi:hypothetical protein